jgi:hypothetical protein
MEGLAVDRSRGATGHCGGTPHSCGSGPAQFYVLPDKSGVPAETMRLDFLQYQGAPQEPAGPSLAFTERHSLNSICRMCIYMIFLSSPLSSALMMAGQ